MRGSARFADFAAGKFATRALTQSLAREFGPKGVHVAHAVIDGAIDVPKMAEFKDKITGGKPDAMLSPQSVSSNAMRPLWAKGDFGAPELTVETDRGELLVFAHAA